MSGGIEAVVQEGRRLRMTMLMAARDEVALNTGRILAELEELEDNLVLKRQLV